MEKMSYTADVLRLELMGIKPLTPTLEETMELLNELIILSNAPGSLGRLGGNVHKEFNFIVNDTGTHVLGEIDRGQRRNYPTPIPIKKFVADRQRK